MVRTFTSSDVFNQLSPFTIGFERVFDMMNTHLESHHPQPTGFPSYNIKKESDEKFSIELALAGYTEDDLSVEVKDGVITVRSNESEKDDVGDDTLYRGISQRKFNRTFTIADDIKVLGASMENGMLVVPLERVVPEHKRSRVIPINKTSKSGETKKEFLAE